MCYDLVTLISLLLAAITGALVACPVCMAFYRRKLRHGGTSPKTFIGVIRHRPRKSQVYVSLVEIDGGGSRSNSTLPSGRKEGLPIRR